MRAVINEFLGAELIPACAVGNELALIDGSLVVNTFSNGDMHGYRKLNDDGDLINIIAEFKTVF